MNQKLSVSMQPSQINLEYFGKIMVFLCASALAAANAYSVTETFDIEIDQDSSNLIVDTYVTVELVLEPGDLTSTLSTSGAGTTTLTCTVDHSISNSPKARVKANGLVVFDWELDDGSNTVSLTPEPGSDGLSVLLDDAERDGTTLTLYVTPGANDPFACRFFPPAHVKTGAPVLWGEAFHTAARGAIVPTTPEYPALVYSGEIYERQVDLHVKGRGLDLVWARTYRSRFSRTDEANLGKGWDHSFNISIAGNNGSSSDPFEVNLGANHIMEFEKLTGNGWWDDGLGAKLKWLSNTGTPNYELLWGDGTVYNFTLGSSLYSNGDLDNGYLTSIVDRHGNTITISYDTANERIDTITDTLGREYDLAYSGAGNIFSITEQDGLSRAVSYTYYGSAEAGGNEGDLKTVTFPPITGTATGNNFPSGRTMTYTYDKSTDVLLNGNLLTIADGKGNTVMTATYDADDRLLTQEWGDDGASDAIVNFNYPDPPTGLETNELTKTIINDGEGHVSECYFNDANLMLRLVEYNGRAEPATVTTETSNRPLGSIRSGDPLTYTTRWEWDDHHQVTKQTYPSGRYDTMAYQPTNRQRANNLIEIKRFDSSDSLITRETFTHYGPWTGGVSMAGCRCEEDFISQHQVFDAKGTDDVGGADDTVEYDIVRRFEADSGNDGGGNVTGISYAELTGFSTTFHETFEYNTQGQLTKHTHPDNGSSHTRDDIYTYHTTGTQTGYLKDVTIDDSGLDLITSYTYDAVGNISTTTPPEGQGNTGWDTQYTFNANDELIRTLSRVPEASGNTTRIQTDYIYDANGNITDIKIANRDSTGTADSNAEIITTYAYDTLNRVTSVTREIDGSTNAVTQTTYNRNALPIIVKSPEAVAGNDPNNIVSYEYDTRDLVYRERRGHGHALQRTIQYDYDANGNLSTQRDGIEEASTRITTYTYDGIDRLTKVTDPESNTIEYAYDGANRVIEELRKDDQATRLAEVDYTYDNSGRLTDIDRAFFDDTGTNVGDGVASTDITYTDAFQLKQVDFEGNDIDYVYDGALRLSTATDVKGNITAYTYDGNTNITTLTQTDKSDLAAGDQVFVTEFEYDQLDRLSKRREQYSTIGPAYNDTLYAYDSRGNLESSTDARNHDTTHTYDSLNRRTASAYELAPAGSTISTSATYDLNSRLTSRTDPNGNATTYTYDLFDRPVAIAYADGSQVGLAYDRFDNVITRTEPSGTVLTQVYDKLNRLTQRTTTPADGYTDPGTETFAYDGLSRMTSASDSDSTVTFTHDSLDNTLDESLAISGGTTRTTSHTYNPNDGTRSQTTYPGGRTIDYTHDALDRLSTITENATTQFTYSYIGNRLEQKKFNANGTQLDYTWNGHATPAGGDVGFRRIAATAHTVTSGGSVLDSRTYEWDRDNNKTQRKDTRSGGPQLTHDYDYDGRNRMTDSDDGTTQVAYNLDAVGNFGISGYELTGPDADLNNYTETPSDTRAYDLQGSLASFDARAKWYTFDAHDRLISFVTAGSRTVDDFSSAIPGDYETPALAGTWSVTDSVLSESTTAPARILRDLPANTTAFAFSYQSSNDPADDTDFDPEKYGLGIIRLDKPDGGDGYRYAAIAIEPTGLYLREWKDDALVAELDSYVTDSEQNTWYDVLVEFSGTDDRDVAISWGKSGQPLEEILTGTLAADLAIAADHVIGFGDGSAGGYEFKDVILRDTSDTTETTEVTYKYDALGRRIQKVIDPDGTPVTTNFYYDGSHAVEERDGVGAVVATYVYGRNIDELLTMNRSSTDYYYHADDLGNIVALTNGSGTIVERYDYDGYGNPTTTGAIGNPYFFNARRYDEETDLYYYRTRYMDPKAGRFISRDTIGQWGDPNNLGNGQMYAGNNPWTYRDPYGEIVETAWDVASLSIGTASLGYNLYHGNYFDAGLDALGVVVDGVATAVPFVPGGAGVAIKAGRIGKAAATAQKADAVINVGQGVASGIDAGVAISEGDTQGAIIHGVGAGLQGLHTGSRIGGSLGGKNAPTPQDLSASSGIQLEFDFVGPKPQTSLRRPGIRKGVRAVVEARANRTADGRPIDPHLDEPIDGVPDLGHKYGQEYWRHKRAAEEEGLTQAEFNDRMNNPDLYQLEEPSSNRSRRFEKKD